MRWRGRRSTRICCPTNGQDCTAPTPRRSSGAPRTTMTRTSTPPPCSPTTGWPPTTCRARCPPRCVRDRRPPPRRRRRRRVAILSWRWSCGARCQTPPSARGSTMWSCWTVPPAPPIAPETSPAPSRLWTRHSPRPGTKRSAERRAQLLATRAELLGDLGREDEGLAVFEQAVSLLPLDPPSAMSAHLLSRQARALARISDMERARDGAERALAAANAVGAIGDRLEAKEVLARTMMSSGQFEPHSSCSDAPPTRRLRPACHGLPVARW